MMRRDLPGLGRIKKKKSVYAEQVKMQLQECKSLAGIETRLGAVKLSIPMTEHGPGWAYTVIQEDGSRKLTQAAGQRAAQADENRSENSGFCRVPDTGRLAQLQYKAGTRNRAAFILPLLQVVKPSLRR